MPIALLNGEIGNTPTGLTDQITVSVPAINVADRRTFGPMKFQPQIAGDRTVRLPARGDKALIAEDTDGGPPWIVDWHREDTSSVPPLIVTALPDPTGLPDGYEIKYRFTPNQSPATIVPITWRFSWNLSSGVWDYVGGPSVSAGNQGDITTSSATDVALTGGPTILTPLQGDWDAYIAIQLMPQVTNSGYRIATLYAGAVGTAVVAHINSTCVNGDSIRLNDANVLGAITAGTSLNIKVSCANALSNRFVNGLIRLVPRRVWT